MKHWSLGTLWGKLVRMGAKITVHWRYVIFQIARDISKRAESPHVMAGAKT